jgi:hypothetical protein
VKFGRLSRLIIVLICLLAILGYLSVNQNWGGAFRTPTPTPIHTKMPTPTQTPTPTFPPKIFFPDGGEPPTATATDVPGGS